MLNDTRLPCAFRNRMQHANPDPIPLQTASSFPIERVPNRSVRFRNDLASPQIINLPLLASHVEAQPETILPDFQFNVAEPRWNRRPIFVPHSSINRAHNLMISNPDIS